MPIQHSAIVMTFLSFVPLPLAYLAFRLIRREEKQYIKDSGYAT